MDRRVLLDRGPVSLGAAWASALCESIQKEGRFVAGGWPGTIVEARTRVSRFLTEELARRRMSPLTVEELTAATNATYAQAKRNWLDVARNLKLEARRRAEAEE